MIKNSNAKKLILWVITILWAAMIFYFSAMPADISAQQSGGIVQKIIEWFGISPKLALLLKEKLQFIVRKSAHFTSYAVFGVFVARLLGEYNWKGAKLLFAAVAICAGYALSDEIHQLFVPGRACMIRDILLDTAGAAVGAFVVLTLVTRNKRKR